MRSEAQMMSLILSVADAEERIRAVILNGSRVNKNVPSDEFQDYDVVYLVTELDSFKVQPDWIDVFGKRIILQMPNSMKLDENDRESEKDELTYLMLFQDFNRIDLKLIELENRAIARDSLSKVLLDKDDLLDKSREPNDQDYRIKRPSPKEFEDCCNEFWWLTTYVLKGVARKEPLYAKEMLEGPLRKMLMKMLAWQVGMETGFSVNLGACHKFLKAYVSPELWSGIKKTYPDLELKRIWLSFMEMSHIFTEISQNVANNMAFHYNHDEANQVKAYIQAMEERISI